jgi:hypothetical protein
MAEVSQRQFVRQQGFPDVLAATCEYQYPALMFQPRLLAGIVLVAIVLQSAAMFLALSGLLWWNALVAARNPFDAVYNWTIARTGSIPRLAPAPRRFFQGMAGTFLAGAGLALIGGRPGLAAIFEGFIVVALGALLFGRFCLGSYLYFLLRGETSFANRTLPWSRAE